jgi:heme-degrading monooxygenase HmoA
MYGTIMRGRLAPGSTVDAFREELEKGEVESAPGFVASHLLKTDAGGDEVWVVVFFIDRASYRANADDPAQHERYVAFRAHLAEDPQWFDGEWDSFTPGT